MKNPQSVINKYYLQVAMALPVLGMLAFTGCSSMSGTAESQQPITNHLASYLEPSQEKPQPADSDPDPQYEWFY